MNGSKHLNEHKIKLHTDQDKCFIFSITFPSMQDMKAHININHPEAIVYCTQCDYKTIKTYKTKMVAHESKDHNIKFIKCNYTTTSNSNLDIHNSKNHNSQGMIKCYKCEYTSKTKKILYLHTLLEHTLQNKIRDYINKFEKLHTILLEKHNIAVEQSVLLRCSHCSYNTIKYTDFKAHACKQINTFKADDNYDIKQAKNSDVDNHTTTEEN